MRLEPAGLQDLLDLADGHDSSHRAPGLSPADYLDLQVEAEHARLVAIKADPHKSKKAKRFLVQRLRARIVELRRQQQDNPSGFRVGSGSWSQPGAVASELQRGWPTGARPREASR